MKLVRNTSPDGLCKYALVRLDKLAANPPRSAEEAQAMNEAFALLERMGVIEYGRAGAEDEFFALKLKDRYAAHALWSYANAIHVTDPEFSDEVAALAKRAGDRSPWCKQPNTDPRAYAIQGSAGPESAVVEQDCGDEGFYCGDPECDACVPPGPQVTPEPKTFWLIERGANQRQSPTMWWSREPDSGVSSYSWVESVHKAAQFDSAEAAEAAAKANYVTHYAVTSHSFVATLPHPALDRANAGERESEPLPPVAIAAYKRIMGDPAMPPDESPAYSRWLFAKVWNAAVAAAFGMEVIDDRAEAAALPAADPERREGAEGVGTPDRSQP